MFYKEGTHMKKAILIILTILFCIGSVALLFMKIPFEHNPVYNYKDKLLDNLKSDYNADFKITDTIFDNNYSLSVKVKSTEKPIEFSAQLFKTNLKTQDTYIVEQKCREIKNIWKNELPFIDIKSMDIAYENDRIYNTRFNKTEYNKVLRQNPLKFLQKYSDTIYVKINTQNKENVNKTAEYIKKYTQPYTGTVCITFVFLEKNKEKIVNTALIGHNFIPSLDTVI